MKINIYILTGLMASFSIVLGVVENFIPSPVPAIRLGLSNIPILIMLCLSETPYAFLTAMLKAFIVPIFSSNIIFKFSLSMPATFVSFIFMALCYRLFKNKLDIVTISVIGAVSHMMTQIIVANFWIVKGILYTRLVGILLLSAVITGILMGLIVSKVIHHSQIKKMFENI